MNKLILVSLALLAACGSKDARKPLDTTACSSFEETYKRFEACTKVEAADRQIGQNSKTSIDGMATAAANAKDDTAKTDLAHVRANTCKAEREKLDQILTKAGC